MTTSDPSEALLPHEVRSLVGQVGDPGGGLGPAPTPAPNAIAGASPGLATAAAKPPPSVPTLPSDDPGALAIMLSRMAGEMLGMSVAPTPSPASAITGAGVAAPASPGISPQLVPSAPAAPSAGLPGDPTVTAGAPALPAIAAPFAPSTIDPSPSFGLGQPPAIAAASPFEAMRVPMFDAGAPAAGAAPYFVPPPDVLGLERAADFTGVTVPAATDARPEHDALVRDLGGGAFDPYAVRRDFPILDEKVHGGKRLVWLDNAATTQKPRAVIDRLTYFYEHENSNIHRAAHAMAARATDAYESGREAVRRFLNAGSTSEIVFV